MGDPIADKIAEARKTKERRDADKEQALIEGPRLAQARAHEVERSLTNELGDTLTKKSPLTHFKSGASSRAFQLINERTGFFIQVLIEAPFDAPMSTRVDITAHFNKRQEKVMVPIDRSGSVDFSALRGRIIEVAGRLADR